jgi:hypothetical protein
LDAFQTPREGWQSRGLGLGGPAAGGAGFEAADCFGTETFGIGEDAGVVFVGFGEFHAGDVVRGFFGRSNA